jgi:TolB-like protein
MGLGGALRLLVVAFGSGDRVGAGAVDAELRGRDRGGQALGAALVLSGAIRYEGQRLRVSYSIVETRRGAGRGDTLDGALTDLFATEDAVSRVLRGLRPAG